MGHKYDDDCPCGECTAEFTRVLLESMDKAENKKRKGGKKDGTNDKEKTARTKQKIKSRS